MKEPTTKPVANKEESSLVTQKPEKMEKNQPTKPDETLKQKIPKENTKELIQKFADTFGFDFDAEKSLLTCNGKSMWIKSPDANSKGLLNVALNIGQFDGGVIAIFTDEKQLASFSKKITRDWDLNSRKKVGLISSTALTFLSKFIGSSNPVENNA